MMKNYGIQIKSEREKKGLTIAELAILCDVTEHDLICLETSCTNTVPQSVLKSVAEALSFDLDI